MWECQADEHASTQSMEACQAPNLADSNWTNVQFLRKNYKFSIAKYILWLIPISQNCKGQGVANKHACFFILIQIKRLNLLPKNSLSTMFFQSRIPAQELHLKT